MTTENPSDPGPRGVATQQFLLPKCQKMRGIRLVRLSYPNEADARATDTPLLRKKAQTIGLQCAFHRRSRTFTTRDQAPAVSALGICMGTRKLLARRYA